MPKRDIAGIQARFFTLMALVVGLGVSFLTLVAAAQTAADDAPSPSVTTNAPSKLWSPEDGWLDLSAFLDESYGFVPLVIPITQPAVGYGAAGGMAFIDKPKGEAQAGFGRPNITVVGGMGTANGSWGVAAADVRFWLEDRLQTVAGLFYAPLNLEFYGIGGDSILDRQPLSYTITPLGGLIKANYRLARQSRWWAGLGYTLASTEVQFDRPASVSPSIFPTQATFRTGGLLPSLSFDSRNNVFTPTRGLYAEASGGVFSEALGGDTEFQKATLIAMGYLPLHPRLTLGLRVDGAATFGDAPFYMRPFISLRGVEAMRYQGEEVAQVEAELRWQFWQRFSLVGFGGVGSDWNAFGRFQRQETVTTCGTGFRYELARKYGLHMGVDVAFGPDEPVFYVQFGSAWLRP